MVGKFVAALINLGLKSSFSFIRFSFSEFLAIADGGVFGAGNLLIRVYA